MKPKQLFIILCLLFITGNLPAQDGVRMYQAPLDLTTYLTGPPDTNPIFYTDRAYQGAKGEVYPYPMQDDLRDTKVVKSWNGLFLENEYIEICILPEIGGKLWYARDKMNGYNFIYYNEEVKPALIGMLGAWTSGGVEWNIPHHHRASTFLPVDYHLEEHHDGSKTIWIGEIERRHRTKWMVGYTLYPGKSYVETTIRLYNRTPLEQSFLIFANAAVHANDNYQIIFPPQTRYGTYHSKTHFTEWPVSHQYYAGRDYTHGVDVTWWKNHPRPISIFDWGNGNFVAGYDHGQDAGTIIVGNPHIMVGRKFWTWGPGPSGSMWDRILTDTGGPYVELMAGAYSDNQPDYSWNNPYMVKTATMTFFPLRDIGHVKRAEVHGALNLEVENSTAIIGVHMTGVYPDATVLLAANDDRIFQQTMDLDPGQPLVREVELPEGVSEYDLSLRVLDQQDREILSYQPVRQANKSMPEAVTRPEAPAQIETVEELYRTGLRLEQFYNPTLEPLPYYQEALRRDPGSSQVNTQMGMYYLKHGDFSSAEEHLRRAVARVTHNYTAPKDAESLYYLGVVLLKQQKYEETYDYLYRATWDYAWHSPGYYLLATIDARRGEYATALEHLEKSLATNNMNNKALLLKASILRKLGEPEKALAVAENVLKDDPLSFLARYESAQAHRAIGATDTAEAILADLEIQMRDDVESYLELATDYGNAGLYTEAVDVLMLAVNSDMDSNTRYPMVHYYLGYYQERLGKTNSAEKFYLMASTLPSDYCFPYRFESADVLKSALKSNPKDAKAHYYLGNLYYDNIPDLAVDHWEQSVQIDDGFALAHRNLAFAYAHHEGDINKAVTAMEKALNLNPDDPRYYAELDRYYERARVTPEKRLALLRDNHQVVSRRDDALAAEVRLLILDGQYDAALEILNTHHFRKIEGVGNIHNQWVDAHLLRGQRYLKEEKPEEAIADFRKALEYPEHLEVGANNRERQVHYFLAKAYESQGEDQTAREHYQKAVEDDYGWSEMRYQQARALEALGKSGQAKEIYAGLIQYGQDQLNATESEDFFEKFSEDEFPEARQADAHFLIGLGYLGQENLRRAEGELQKAKALNPAHLGATVYMRKLENGEVSAR